MRLDRQDREAAIVAALLIGEMMGQSTMDSHALEPRELHNRDLAALLGTMQSLKTANKPVDPLSVCDELGSERLQSLAFSITDGQLLPGDEVIDGWIEQQREENSARTWTDVLHRAAQGLEQGTHTVAEILAHVDDFRASEAIRGAEVYPHKDAMQEALISIENASEEQSVPSVPTGCVDFDTHGLLEGELTYIAAYPSVGKTELALTMATGAARAGSGVLFVTAEMSRQMLVIRELSAASGVDMDRIVRATMGSYEFDKVIGAFGKISDLPIWYSECRDIPRLCSVATRLRQRHDVRLMFVDYLQLLDLPPGETMERQIAEASSRFKRLAVKTGLSVVLLSQLSNPRDGDFSRPPSMGQLRGSGMLMADADRVVMLHRPGQGKPDEDHTLLANIAKSRNGPPGVRIEFRFHRGRILNAARQHEEALS